MRFFKQCFVVFHVVFSAIFHAIFHAIFKAIFLDFFIQFFNAIFHVISVCFHFCRCPSYTMLCGRPPFEMPTLKETFKRISDNKFSLPSFLSTASKDLIKKLLNQEPSARPALAAILFEDFFTTGYAPASLSPCFCEKSPKFSASTQLPRSVVLLKMSYISVQTHT